MEVYDPSGSTEITELHAPRLETLNGKKIAGSPFAVEVKRWSSIKYVFRSVATGAYALSEGDTVVTKVEKSWRGAIADGQFVDGGAGAGAAAAPMVEGQEYAEFELAKQSGNELLGQEESAGEYKHWLRKA